MRNAYATTDRVHKWHLDEVFFTVGITNNIPYAGAVPRRVNLNDLVFIRQGQADAD